MPALTAEPSGTLVEVLCGQPEQKYGVRVTIGSSAGPRREPPSTARRQPPLTRALSPGALLLHDDDLVQTFGELGDLGRDQRVDHSQPQQPHAARAQPRVVKPEDPQRLPDVQVRLPGGDDPDPASLVGTLFSGSRGTDVCHPLR